MNVASELYMVVTRRNTKNVVDRNTHRIRSWDKNNNTFVFVRNLRDWQRTIQKDDPQKKQGWSQSPI